jgi:hypothetical protein
MKPRNYVAKAQQSGAGKHANRKYKGIVAFKYYQQIEVEADNIDDAKQAMIESFDISKAEADCDVYDLWEMGNERL